MVFYLQAQLVSKELIRVAILWHELWHEALEEASRLYFGEHNIEGMLKVLEPLHEMLEEGAMKNNVTIKERVFIEVVLLSLPVIIINHNDVQLTVFETSVVLHNVLPWFFRFTIF